jgi:hypothetical protein
VHNCKTVFVAVNALISPCLKPAAENYILTTLRSIYWLARALGAKGLETVDPKAVESFTLRKKKES